MYDLLQNFYFYSCSQLHSYSKWRLIDPNILYVCAGNERLRARVIVDAHICASPSIIPVADGLLVLHTTHNRCLTTVPCQAVSQAGWREEPISGVLRTVNDLVAQRACEDISQVIDVPNVKTRASALCVHLI